MSEEGECVGGSPVEIDCQLCHFFVMFKAIVVDFLLMNLIWLIALMMIVIGGFLMLVSGGSPALRQKANDIFRATVWGLAICLLAWITVNTFFLAIGLKEDYRPWSEIKCPIELHSSDAPLAGPGEEEEEEEEEEEDVQCNDYKTKPECKSEDCYWYEDACHECMDDGEQCRKWWMPKVLGAPPLCKNCCNDSYCEGVLVKKCYCGKEMLLLNGAPEMSISLTLTPSKVELSGDRQVEATISGISGAEYSGETIKVVEGGVCGLLTPDTVCDCTISSEGCSCFFTAPDTADKIGYRACTKGHSSDLVYLYVGPPKKAEVIYPKDGFLTSSLDFNFEWKYQTECQGYKFRIKKSEEDSYNLSADDYSSRPGITGSRNYSDLQYDTSYDWGVRACLAEDFCSDWSNWSFTTPTEST